MNEERMMSCVWLFGLFFIYWKYSIIYFTRLKGYGNIVTACGGLMLAGAHRATVSLPFLSRTGRKYNGKAHGSR